MRKLEAWTILTLVLEFLVVVGLWFLAYHLRFAYLPVPKGIPPIEIYIKIVPLIALAWLAVTLGMHDGMHWEKSKIRFETVMAFFSKFLIVAFLVVGICFFFSEYRYSRLHLLVFFIITPLPVLLLRSLMGFFLKMGLRRKEQRFVVFTSKNYKGKALEVANKLCLFGKVNVVDMTFVDTLSDKQDWSEYFMRKACDTVLICVPFSEYSFVENHAHRILDQVLDVKIVPDVLRVDRLATSVSMVQNDPVIHVHDSPLKGLGQWLKRALDVFGALFGIIVLSPLLLLLALLVKLSSKGPVFYKQKRMSVDGDVFTIYKFRTMPVDSEGAKGAVWATAQDSRPTKFGRFLRKSSLDEFPQLYNVLRGDMSLVGPRPERPIFVKEFRNSIPGYMLRHKVRCGMTGWAQVHGWRGDTSIEKRIEYDLYYIQNWSIWLDLKIILVTFVKGFVHPHAY